jgi:hypothetical protein
MKSDNKDKQIKALLNFFDFQTPDRMKKKNFDKIDEILGYELSFIFSAIVVNKYSGNLIIVNEKNELSGVNFLNGNIIGIDYPDKDYLLGDLIVEADITSKNEMKEILTNISGNKLGAYLLKNSLISEHQLRKILHKQSRLRIGKYITNQIVRINFNLDEVVESDFLLGNVDFFEILHAWIFEDFKTEWLQNYASYFDRLNFNVNGVNEDLDFFQRFPSLTDHFKKLNNLPSKSFKFSNLAALLNISSEESLRLIMFMMQVGFVSCNALALRLGLSAPVRTESIKSDFVAIKSYILIKKYFEAFNIINKYSGQINSNEMVEFYFAWIRLHSKYYKNFNLDLKKTSEALLKIDPNKVGLADYYYVRALLEACKNDKEQCLAFYAKAILQDSSLKAYPILSSGENLSNQSGLKSVFLKTLRKIGLN